MNLLALETSTERLSLAILRDGRLFARDVDAGQRHSDLTLPLLYELLEESGLVMQDLDAIAFGQGPGSFTGVRIACGLAQGIALGLAKRVVPVETQMALAEQAGGEKVLVALDARMGEIYLAAYRVSATAPTGWEAVIAPCLARPDTLPTLAGEGWIGIGSGFDAPALATVLDRAYGAGLVALRVAALPSATEVLRIAERKMTRGGADAALPPSQAAPLYLRNKVAMTIDERRTLHELKRAGAAA